MLRQPIGASNDEIVIHPGLISAEHAHSEGNKYNSFLPVARPRSRDAIEEVVYNSFLPVAKPRSRVMTLEEVVTDQVTPSKEADNVIIDMRPGYSREPQPSPIKADQPSASSARQISTARTEEIPKNKQRRHVQAYNSQPVKSDKASSIDMSSLILKSLNTASAALNKNSAKQPTQSTSATTSPKQPTKSASAATSPKQPTKSTSAAKSSEKAAPITNKDKPTGSLPKKNSFTDNQKLKLRKMLVRPVTLDQMRKALQGPLFLFSQDIACSYTIHEILFEIFGKRYEEHIVVLPDSQQDKYMISDINIDAIFTGKDGQLNSLLTVEQKAYMKSRLATPQTYSEMFNLLKWFHNSVAYFEYTSREILGCLFEDEQNVIFGINDQFAETFMANPSPAKKEPLRLSDDLRRALINTLSQQKFATGIMLQEMMEYFPGYSIFRSSEEIMTALLGPSYEDHLLIKRTVEGNLLRFKLAQPKSWKKLIKNSTRLTKSERAASKALGTLTFEEPEIDEQSFIETVLTDSAFRYEEEYHKY